MTDIVKRLKRVRYTRERGDGPNGTYFEEPCDADDADAVVSLINPDGPEAADEIERLRAANAALPRSASVQCTHEAYLGRCVHCGAQIINGRAMLAASPDPTTDEALVSRLAWKIADALGDGLHGNSPGYLNAARAAIRAMEGKP